MRHLGHVSSCSQQLAWHKYSERAILRVYFTQQGGEDKTHGQLRSRLTASHMSHRGKGRVSIASSLSLIVQSNISNNLRIYNIVKKYNVCILIKCKNNYHSLPQPRSTNCWLGIRKFILSSNGYGKSDANQSIEFSFGPWSMTDWALGIFWEEGTCNLILTIVIYVIAWWRNQRTISLWTAHLQGCAGISSTLIYL